MKQNIGFISVILLLLYLFFRAVKELSGLIRNPDTGSRARILILTLSAVGSGIGSLFLIFIYLIILL
jgi:hypothetical protein